jgi:effector-binding domain-containing protein
MDGGTMFCIQHRKTEPLFVASIRHTGPYQELGPVYQRLTEWLQQNKVTPRGFIREIGYDNPMQTPPEKCRQEVCVPIAESVKSDKDIELKALPVKTVITVVHKGGMDFASLGPAYQSIMAYAAENKISTDYSIITYFSSPNDRQNAEVEIALTTK